ncbi:helix-turn-helix domain-containing protein [Dehalogenimonas sp. THU2]|uniref:helix-turn-helix domain-containing protein n=1 Tax=Dehalogenimonas sp. THU2 TaxID=3151121 RepID=UPI0032185A73
MSTQSITINQAAEKLGVSTRTIRRYIKAGKIQAYLVNGPFGEEYRIQELPDDLKKLEGVDSTGQTGLDNHDPLAAASGDMMAVFRELQEKNLALAAQLGAATEHIRNLEGQMRLLTDGRPPQTSWWQKWYAGLKSRFNKKAAEDSTSESAL